MTIEEFYKEYPEFNYIESPTLIMEDIIRKEYESRKCENCIEFKADVATYGEYEGTCLAGIIQHQDLGTVKIDFGCTEWESKDG